MSDLQIVLIVIGALIIFAVVVINWWQERRFHRQVEKSFSSLQSDALLDDPKLDTRDVVDISFDPALDNFSFHKTFPGERLNGETLNAEPEELDDVDSARGSVVSRYSEEPVISSSFPKIPNNRYVKPSEFNIPDEDFPIETLPDNISIDEAYSQLSKVIPKTRDYSTQGYSEDVEDDIRLAQHDDIKAIFSEAFSQSNPSSLSEPVATSNKNIFSKNENEKKVTELSLPTVLHSQVDLTALLYLAIDTEISTLRAAFNGFLSGYDKIIMVHVLTANKEWHLLFEKLNQDKLNDSDLASKVACSLQLADRSGAVSRQTLNRFQLAVESIGLDINAHVEWQSTGDALVVANMLDTFCIEVDKTIGFHLIHGENGAFTGTKLRGLAEAQGFTLDADGTFKFLEDTTRTNSSSHQEPSFVIFNREDHLFSPEMLRTSVVKGITFQLDIPHVKHCAEAFTQMVKVAMQMEIGLNAVLVDDNNKILGDIQIEKIRQQLKVIHATMLVRGIIPGSDSAHRLFS